MAGIVGALLVALGPAEAHTPHDDISDIELSPTFATDRTIWVIAGNRLLRSTDAGISWEARVRGLPRPPEVDKSLAQLAIVRERPEVMYVTSRIGGVFRTDDGGETWRAVGEGLPTGDLNVLAASPTDTDLVVVGGSLGGSWVSTDGGGSWEAVARSMFVYDALVDGDGRVALAGDDGITWYDPATGDRDEVELGAPVTALRLDGDDLLAGTADGTLHRSVRGGPFEQIGEGLPEERITGIEVDPTGTERVWVVGATAGTYRSDDGGGSFEPAGAGLTTDIQADEVGVSQFRTVVAGEGPGGVQLFTAGFDGLFRSDDGGRTWLAAETLAEYVVGLALSPGFPDDRLVAAVTYVKGAYVSLDGGDTWTAVNEGIGHDLSAGNEIAPVRRLHNIAFSPTFEQDGLLFSATWTTFLRGTLDGGWEEVQVGRAPEGSLLRQFVMGIAPDFAESPTIFLGTRQGTLYRSLAAGEAGSWEELAELGSRVRTIEVAPGADGDRVLYAGTVEGVLRSGDGGATWAPTGPDSVAMLAMSPTFADDGTVFAGTEEGLWVTRDDGATWSEAVTGAGPGAGVEAIAVSPAFDRDGTVLASFTGRGLFRSTDGGRTFEEVGTELTRANHVIADFTNPTGDPIQFSPGFGEDRTVFAYADQFVLRSTDAGETWELLELPSLEDFLLETDPSVLRQIVTDVTPPPPPRAGPGKVGTAVTASTVLVVLVVLLATALVSRRLPRSS